MQMRSIYSQINCCTSRLHTCCKKWPPVPDAPVQTAVFLAVHRRPPSLNAACARHAPLARSHGRARDSLQRVSIEKQRTAAWRHHTAVLGLPTAWRPRCHLHAAISYIHLKCLANKARQCAPRIRKSSCKEQYILSSSPGCQAWRSNQVACAFNNCVPWHVQCCSLPAAWPAQCRLQQRARPAAVLPSAAAWVPHAAEGP